MTVSEMHLALRLNLDKSTSLGGSPDFLPEEFDFWLNEAQDRYIKLRMFGNNNAKTGFEQSQKRVDDLKALLVITDKLTLSSSMMGPNVKEVALPISSSTSPYLYYVNSSVYDVSGNELQTGAIMQQEYINDYLKDAINNPYIRRPYVLFYYNNGPVIGFIYGDEFVPTQCDITYIKKPKALTSFTVSGYQTNTCELSEHTHREIVDLATSLLIENIESGRVQTYDPINLSKVE